MTANIFIKAALTMLLFRSVTEAQPFFPLGTGVDRAVLALYGDSATNLLYAGGEFSQAGSVQSHCIAKWNGIDWDSTRNQFPFPPFHQIRKIEKFNNEIYVGGIIGLFDTTGNQIGYGLAKWDSTNSVWDSCGGYVHGSVQCLYNYNGQLYVGGTFDTIGGIYSEKIVRYDGINWYAFPSLDTVNGGWAVNAAMFYNGDLYVGGNFDSQIATNMKDIALWDGNQWQTVGGGLSGGFTWVKDFAIYQGKLIVAGFFNTANGDPGNAIAAWDGTTWSQLGTNLTAGNIQAVEVYNGELWAGGGLTINGSTVPLGKWNGSQWDTLGVTLDNTVTSFAVLGNDLYIGGSFWTMDGDTVNRIIRYNYLTGFDDLMPDGNGIEVYPNPASGNFKIKYSMPQNQNGVFEMFDITGRKALSYSIPQSSTFQTITLPELAKGVYVCKLRSGEYEAVKKIVVQ